MQYLSDVPAGGTCHIMSYADDLIATKLISMGLYPGMQVTVLDRNHRHYALMLVAGSLKLALLLAEAQSVVIEMNNQNG